MLSPGGHYRRFVFRRHGLAVSTFLRPVAPRPLRRFFATMGALTPAPVSVQTQVSLLHVTAPSDHSVPRHHMPTCRRLVTQSLSRLEHGCPSGTSAAGFPLFGRVWASPILRRLASTHGRIGFLSYGLVVHLLLLPTPSRDDAVAVGFRPKCEHLAGTRTPLTQYARSRTEAPGSCRARGRAGARPLTARETAPSPRT